MTFEQFPKQEQSAESEAKIQEVLMQVKNFAAEANAEQVARLKSLIGETLKTEAAEANTRGERIERYEDMLG